MTLLSSKDNSDEIVIDFTYSRDAKCLLGWVSFSTQLRAHVTTGS
jgi:hypothetical protein